MVKRLDKILKRKAQVGFKRVSSPAAVAQWHYRAAVTNVRQPFHRARSSAIPTSASIARGHTAIHSMMHTFQCQHPLPMWTGAETPCST
jgi:hypothetical protein